MSQESDLLQEAYCETLGVEHCSTSNGDCKIQDRQCVPSEGARKRYHTNVGVLRKIYNWDDTGTRRQHAFDELSKRSASKTKVDVMKNGDTRITIPIYGLLYVKPRHVIICPSSVTTIRPSHEGFNKMTSNNDEAQVIIPQKHVATHVYCDYGVFNLQSIIAFYSHNADWFNTKNANSQLNMAKMCEFKTESVIVLAGQDIYSFKVMARTEVFFGCGLELIGHTIPLNSSVPIRTLRNGSIQFVNNSDRDADIYYKQ